jgi:hypothetical protein
MKNKSQNQIEQEKRIAIIQVLFFIVVGLLVFLFGLVLSTKI